MKKHIFIILLMFFIHPNCLAGSTKDATKNVSKESPKNQNSIPLQLNKLQNNNKWQRFIQQKELNDINYDLYRIVGPNVDQSVIEHGAQDPYGYLVSKHNDTFCSRVIDPQCKVASPLYEYGDIRASLLLDQNLYKDQKEK